MLYSNFQSHIYYDRCEEGDGSNFLLVTSDGDTETTREENFSNLGCSKQYREYFNKTSRKCGIDQEGELVEVEDIFQDDISIHLLTQVGFQTESDSKFYWMFTSCHDKVKGGRARPL